MVANGTPAQKGGVVVAQRHIRSGGAIIIRFRLGAKGIWDRIMVEVDVGTHCLALGEEQPQLADHCGAPFHLGLQTHP